MENRSKVIDCIFKRRSIRNLKSDPIPQKDIDLLLQCLEAAPSAGNLQPWYFYVIKNQDLKKTLCELSFNQVVVEQAPVVFAVCAVPAVSQKEYGDCGSVLTEGTWTRTVAPTDLEQLYELSVIVTWSERGRERTFGLVTLGAER